MPDQQLENFAKTGVCGYAHAVSGPKEDDVAKEIGASASGK